MFEIGERLSTRAVIFVCVLLQMHSKNERIFLHILSLILEYMSIERAAGVVQKYSLFARYSCRTGSHLLEQFYCPPRRSFGTEVQEIPFIPSMS